MGYRSDYSLDWRVLILTRVRLVEASLSVVECGFIQHAGEGGEVWQGKKDTGYLYKDFMDAIRGIVWPAHSPIMDVDQMVTVVVTWHSFKN